MLDIYSNNVTVAEQSPIPFNSTNVDKGCGITRPGTVTIQFNKCGVYKVDFHATAVAGTAGTITVQLRKNGILQPQTLTSQTAADTTSSYTLGFSTLIQVDRNNCKCNMCSIPVTIDVFNASTIPVTLDAGIVVTPVAR